MKHLNDRYSSLPTSKVRMFLSSTFYTNQEMGCFDADRLISKSIPARYLIYFVLGESISHLPVKMFSVAIFVETCTKGKEFMWSFA